jgi:hypothetical protein
MVENEQTTPKTPKLKEQPDLFQFCPFCKAEYAEKQSGNIEITCPECDKSYIVRKV